MGDSDGIDYGFDMTHGFNDSGLLDGFINSFGALGFDEAQTEVIGVTGNPFDNAEELMQTQMRIMELRIMQLEQSILQQQIRMDAMLVKLEQEATERRREDANAAYERCALALALGVVRCDNLRQDIAANQVDCAGIGTLTSIAYSRSFGSAGRFLGSAEVGALAAQTCSYFRGNSANEAHAACMTGINSQVPVCDAHLG